MAGVGRQARNESLGQGLGDGGRSLVGHTGGDLLVEGDAKGLAALEVEQAAGVSQTPDGNLKLATLLLTYGHHAGERSPTSTR